MTEYIDLTNEDVHSSDARNQDETSQQPLRRQSRPAESSDDDEVVLVEMRQVSPPRQSEPQQPNSSCEEVQIVGARPLTAQQRMERIRQEHRRRADIAQASGQTEPRPDMPTLAFGLPPPRMPSRTWGALFRDELDDTDNDPDYEPQRDTEQDLDSEFEHDLDEEVFGGQLSHFFGGLSRIFTNINDVHVFPTRQRPVPPQRRSRRPPIPTRPHTRAIFRPPYMDATRGPPNISALRQHPGLINVNARPGEDLGSLEHRMLEHALMHSLEETSSYKQLSVDQLRKPAEPSSAPPGFTRRACDNAECICCGCTLGEGKEGLHGDDFLLSQRVFARGCQHVYCGRCAFDVSKAQGKAKQCPVPECRRLRSRAKNKFRELWV